MQQRVLVVDKNRKPLMPCSPARARQLLRQGRAAIFRYRPFTILLKHREGGEVQPLGVKLDPGAEVSGVALVAGFGNQNQTAVWGGEIRHRSKTIRKALAERRALRRSRRNRKTRYRKPRFLNRNPARCDSCGRNARHGGRYCRLCTPGTGQGLRDRRLPPSLESRVSNIVTWAARLSRYAPVSWITTEHVKFDPQLLQNPNLSGVEYQQGELYGYELREYLLEKFGHRCAYCDRASGDPILNIDHVIPRSRGGSNRVSNLVIACRTCNQTKGNRLPEKWLGELKVSPRALDRIRAKNLEAVAKGPGGSLRSAAAINAIRWVLLERLKGLGLPLELGSGGQTKYNRTCQGYPKGHWIDAACTGESGKGVRLDPAMKILRIEAKGHGKRQRCGTDKYGFPIRHAPKGKSYGGFRTGDLVRAAVPQGKHAGIHVGHIAIRHRPSFRLGGFDVHPKHLKILQKGDGYAYTTE